MTSSERRALIAYLQEDDTADLETLSESSRIAVLDTAYETVVKQGFAGLKNLAEDSAKALEGAAQDIKDSAKGLLKGIF